MMLAKGVSIPDVMALSGHKSMKSFQRYVDVSKEQREVAINKLDEEWSKYKVRNSAYQVRSTQEYAPLRTQLCGERKYHKNKRKL